MLFVANCSDTEHRKAHRAGYPAAAPYGWPGFSLRALDKRKRSNLMEGFIALGVFARQMSDLQEKLHSTQPKKEDRSSSNRGKVALLTVQNSAMEGSRHRVQVEEKLTETKTSVSCCYAGKD
jgi:hypothetical protein